MAIFIYNKSINLWMARREVNFGKEARIGPGEIYISMFQLRKSPEKQL